jgi:hypothetical protein
MSNCPECGRELHDVEAREFVECKECRRSTRVRQSRIPSLYDPSTWPWDPDTLENEEDKAI